MLFLALSGRLEDAAAGTGGAPQRVQGAPRSVRQRLDELEAALPEAVPVEAWPARHWAQARLHLRKARFLLDSARGHAGPPDAIPRELDRAVAALEAMGSAEAPAVAAGAWEAAYWCELDGSAQPFGVYLPGSYDGRRPYPLLVYLHGYSPYLNIVNWLQWPPALLETAEQDGFLAAAPFGRGNTDFQGIGERDVLAVIDEMQRRYRVADDRILLVGYSMGGMGAWTIAAHYPHLFAGALVVSGRACYYAWHGVRREDLPRYKRVWIDTEFARSLLPNLASLPVLCYHGAADRLVPVEEARTMARALQPLNDRFAYVEIEGADHWIVDRVLNRPNARRWLRRQRRTVPETFAYVSWHPRYARAHWLTLDPVGRHAVRREVRVESSGAGLVVHADPAGRVYWHPDRLPSSVAPGAVRGAPGVDLVRGVEAFLPPRPPRGPLKEFFLEPFVFVQAGDSAAGGAVCARFAERCREWERYAQAPPRRVCESALDAAGRRRFNVFLFGEPEDSPMIRGVLESVPVAVTPETYRVGDAAIPRAGNGLLMVVRSPWRADRLVAVQCGHPWGEHLPSNHRYDFVPDIIVYGSGSDADGSNRALLAGFFDERGTPVVETWLREGP